MENWKVKLIEELENVGKKELKNWISSMKYDPAIGVKDVKDFRRDSKKSIKKFVQTGFFRGRSDWLSDFYFRIFAEAFDTVFGKEVINSAVLVEKSKDLIDCFERGIVSLGYSVNPRDKEMLESIFEEFLPKLGETNYNPILWTIGKIMTGKTIEAFKEIRKIREWGFKITALSLRDTILFFDLEKHLEETDYYYLFPIDTHVRKMCKLLWPDLENASDDTIIEKVLKELKGMKKALGREISPLYLNIGLWFISSKAYNLIEILVANVGNGK